MKVGIMQPYFMPYIGYWQLISEVDKYVIFDDVNFIKNGWINRNRILLDGKQHMFVLPLEKASQNKRINELFIFNGEEEKRKLWMKVKQVYGKAPYFKETKELLEQCIRCGEEHLVKYITNSIKHICQYLEIKTEIVVSSEIERDIEKKAQERILDICKVLGTDIYINAIGGRGLYDVDIFAEMGVKLQFLKTNFVRYPQKAEYFIPGLSLIDILSNVSKSEIMDMLGKYEMLDNTNSEQKQILGISITREENK